MEDAAKQVPSVFCRGRRHYAGALCGSAYELKPGTASDYSLLLSRLSPAAQAPAAIPSISTSPRPPGTPEPPTTFVGASSRCFSGKDCARCVRGMQGKSDKLKAGSQCSPEAVHGLNPFSGRPIDGFLGKEFHVRLRLPDSLLLRLCPVSSPSGHV
jgi:hypothetical protein